VPWDDGPSGARSVRACVRFFPFVSPLSTGYLDERRGGGIWLAPPLWVVVVNRLRRLRPPPAPPPCPAATTTPPSTTTPRRAASAIAITSANRRRPRKRDTRHDTPLLRALPVSAVAIGGGRCQCRDRRCRSHRHHQRAGAAIRFIAGVPISVIARGASRQE
jgi:hypothetical protein